MPGLDVAFGGLVHAIADTVSRFSDPTINWVLTVALWIAAFSPVTISRLQRRHLKWWRFVIILGAVSFTLLSISSTIEKIDLEHRLASDESRLTKIENNTDRILGIVSRPQPQQPKAKPASTLPPQIVYVAASPRATMAPVPTRISTPAALPTVTPTQRPKNPVVIARIEPVYAPLQNGDTNVYVNIYMTTSETVTATVNAAGAIAVTPVQDQFTQTTDLNIANLRQAALKARASHVSPSFTLSPQQASFFTVTGHVLSPQQTADFKAGKLMFYFVGLIDIQSAEGSYQLPFCGMNFGDPRVVMDCPQQISRLPGAH